MTTEVKGIKTTKFSGIENARIHNLTLQGGVTALLCFTVSENSDDKEAGKYHQITDMKVTFDGTLIQNLLASAMARRVIQWAPKIRENPTRATELTGAVRRFDEPIFPGLPLKARTVTVARPPTEEEIKTYLASQRLADQMRTTIQLMKIHGADTELMEAELEALTFVENEEKKEDKEFAGRR